MERVECRDSVIMSSGGLDRNVLYTDPLKERGGYGRTFADEREGEA
jgi:hypothetical protein